MTESFINLMLLLMIIFVEKVVDGHALLCAARRTPIGGRMLSAHLLRALDARGVDLAAASPRAVAAAARGVTLSASYLAEMRMNVAEDIKVGVACHFYCFIREYY